MRRIDIDCKLVKGAHNKYASCCVGAGRAGEALRKDFQDQLEKAARECGFKYLRFHGIFHDEMGVYTEDEKGNAVYNWQYIDLVYDAILDRGMKPFVELSFMPQALSSGSKTVFWWNANVTPPKDYSRWYDLIHNFTLHLQERYGRDEVASWYFEVWNEPNHPAFFSGTQEDYLHMYDVTAQAVKDVDRLFRVGGPASAGSEWVGDLIEHCSINRIPLDFISTHTYGVEGAFDEFGNSTLYLRKDRDAVIKDVQGVYEIVKASSMPDLEIHYTEWSSSYSSRDPVHDTYLQAAYILHNVKGLEGYVNSMSYWTFTDIFEEVGPPPMPFHGGFGLINLQSLKKPAYYAYKFYYELGETELVNSDEESWACCDDRGVQALLWKYAKPEQDDCNSRYFKRIHAAGPGDSVTLAIYGLSEGKYKLKVYKTGFDCNDVYTAYVGKGSPNTLGRMEIKDLEKSCSGLPIRQEYIDIGKDAVFNYVLDIRENDIYLVKLEKAV